MKKKQSKKKQLKKTTFEEHVSYRSLLDNHTWGHQFKGEIESVVRRDARDFRKFPLNDDLKIGALIRILEKLDSILYELRRTRTLQ